MTTRWQCEQCPKSFAQSSSLRLHHRSVHLQLRPYACSKCSKSFSQAGNLQRHMEVMHDGMQYGCEQCRSKFVDLDSLNRHVQCVHQGERWQCEQCDKTFAHQYSMQKHVASIHKNHIRHPCNQCSKTFSSADGLKRHVNVDHNGLRSRCQLCSKDFAGTDSLRIHVQSVHNNQRHQCQQCSADFANAANLQSHVRVIHLDIKAYVCDHPDCSAFPPRFASGGNLIQHVKSHHSSEGRQRKKKQEEAMKNALVAAGFVQVFEHGRVPAPGEFVREVYFDHRCALGRNFMPGEKKCAYVDFVVCTPDGRLVFLEVDENQHKDAYSQLCETTRMWNVCESIALAEVGEMNVFWLRFNPDKPYTVAGVERHPNPSDRRNEVCSFLKALRSSPTDPPMQVGYACYDQHAGGRPLVLDDPEYHSDVKPALMCISKGSHILLQPSPFAPLDSMFAPMPSMNLYEEDDEGNAPPSPKRMCV